MKCKKGLISILLTASLTLGLFAGISVNEKYADAEVVEGSTATITADCSDVEREVMPGTFGYILTPNYDVPDSRISLLGKVLNRESLPVQNFQACGDLDGNTFKYESSVKERHLEAFRRGKECNVDWYMLMGMNPSWATASGGPRDTDQNTPLKTPKQIADFKQYLKDMFQYLRDNGAIPDYADLTNEYWTGTEEIFKVVWEALREVYPEYIPVVGPGGVGYDGIPDFYIPFCDENDITVEGPSWHAFWTGDRYASFDRLKKWVEGVAVYQKQHPKANGKWIIWEENNAGSTDATDWTRSLSNIIRTGVYCNIKGCLESNNWNGMSDLLTTKEKAANSAVRRDMWWVYYLFGQLTGNYVHVDTIADSKAADDAFTGVVAVDDKEKCIKVAVASPEEDGEIKVKLNNIPFEMTGVEINLYKVVDSENDGLAWQRSITPDSYTNGNMEFTIESGSDETWYAIVENSNYKPEFFAQKAPDDGNVVTSRPEFSWSESTGASSYNLTVSKNKDLSDPVINKTGITGTSYTSEVDLQVGSTYYWGLTAVNANGSTPNSHNVVYKFLVGDNADVPGQFGPYLPSVGAKNEPLDTELTWSTAYNANSYHVIVSEKEDMSDPVIDEDGIKTVRGTGQFGSNSQGYYKIKAGTLDYEKKYYWKVYAANTAGERPMNGVAHYFTTCGSGTAPHDFGLVSPANDAKDVKGHAVLEWKESVNAFFYQLIVSEHEDLADPVIQRDYMIYNRYTLEQNALEPGRKYYWTVKAYTKDRKEVTDASNGIWSFTMADVPSAPLLYAEQPDEDEAGAVTVWYHKSNNADSYNIYYGKEPGVYTRKISGVTYDGYSISGLKGGQPYYIAMTAVNSAGESDIWNERMVVPGGLTPNWTEMGEEGEYIAPPKKDDTQNAGNNSGNPGNTVNQTGNPVNVQTTATTGTTPDAVSSATVTKPAKPVIKSVKSPKKKTVKVSWKKVKGADGYRVMVATDKKFGKGKKTKIIAKGKTVTTTIKGLKSKKTYYVKVCAFKKSGSNKIFGKYSKVKTVKIK